jgi:hypothetical protein
MKSMKFAGALLAAFVLGGVTTLLGVPRSTPNAAVAGATISISPEEITRSAGPLLETVVDNYM